ncbi:MAG: hypothetical protein GWN67_25205 [Phycisphaerae bacterium]|nr:hypothetical protein [Phycisphaerae bacterium]NIR68294.1 hypothetical protein [candidate division Zixibacteria bacterium]NIP55654.1 hypothetical protein [Phycisphaerae bacterium]NIS54756.1 hypothetical protein [Phycisphaerae bacterium]NIU11988.1 hypothetical protein [Phycisphaerae bacterium]
MKQFGYLMITLGFLAGALVAVVDKDQVQWGYFCGAIAVGIAGILLVRAGKRGQIRSEGKLTANIQNIEAGLTRIVENISNLNSEKQSINPYDVRHRIDALFTEDIISFVEARESIGHVYGLAAYADIMSYFASGERYLNRVWSASADGYIDEVAAYLEKAQLQFSEALEKLRRQKQQPRDLRTAL